MRVFTAQLIANNKLFTIIIMNYGIRSLKVKAYRHVSGFLNRKDKYASPEINLSVNDGRGARKNRYSYFK